MRHIKRYSFEKNLHMNNMLRRSNKFQEQHNLKWELYNKGDHLLPSPLQFTIHNSTDKLFDAMKSTQSS